MWIKSARVDGYGRIGERGFEFAGGLNCIHGPNEAGKTTLLSFLVSMLYGQATPGLRVRRLEECNERYRPWRTPLYSGDIAIASAGGKTVVIRRDFSGDADGIEILEGVTGQSLRDNYERNRRREYTFAESHTGVDKLLFTAAFVIGHGQLAGISDAETRLLADRVMALAQTGNEARSAEVAREALGRLIEAIGSDGAPTRPFRRTQDALTRERDQLQRARECHEQCAEEMARRAELERQIAVAKEQLGAKSRHLFRSIEARLAALEKETDELRARADSEQALKAPESLRRLEPEGLAAVERGLAEFVRARGAFREMQRRLDALAAAVGQGKRSLEEGARTIQAISVDGRNFLAAAGDQKSELLEQMARKKERLSQARRLRSGMAVLRILGVLLLVAGAAAAAAIYLLTSVAAKPLLAALAFVAPAAAGVFLLLRSARVARKYAEFRDAEKDYQELAKRLHAHELKLGEILSAFGGQSRQEVLEAVEEFERQTKEVEQAERDRSALEKRVDSERPVVEAAWQRAAEGLEPAGLTPSNSLSQSVQSVLDGRAPRGAAPEAAANMFADVKSADDVAAVFQPLYLKTRELAESRQRLSLAQGRLAEVEPRMQALLAGHTREEIRRLSQTGEAAGGAAPLSEDEIPRAKREMDSDRERLAALELELAQVSGRLEESLKDLPEVAALEERISTLEERNGVQSFCRAALDESIRVIDEAAAAFHKRIFPRLEGNLNTLLAPVTLGAHGQARLWVEEDQAGSPVRFSVSDEIKGAPVAPEALSQGACEQLYLCARLALAQALSRKEPVPVMLDDPFINYDPERLKAALAMLASVASERQVFLFTCQDDVRDLAVGAGAATIEL